MVLEKTLYNTGALTVSYILVKLSQSLFTYLRPSTLPRYLHGEEPWALVTGASDGIGYALAYELCQHGFNVILHGRNLPKLEKCKANINRDFPLSQIRIVIANASSHSSDSVEDLAASIKHLRLTVLINNVGGTGGIIFPVFKSFETNTRDEVDGLMNVNDRFPTQLTRGLLPTLIQNQPALIMNISSQSKIGIPYLSVYSATKGFIESWTRALSIEFKGQGQDIEVLGMRVGSVESKSNRVQSTNLFNPSSKTMAKAALDRVGCGNAIVTGYFPHALQEFIFDLLPEPLSQRILLQTVKAFEHNKDKQQWFVASLKEDVSKSISR